MAPGAAAGDPPRPGAAPAAETSSETAPSLGFVSDSMGFTAADEITAAATKDRALSYLSTIQGSDISDHRDDLVALTQGEGAPEILVIMLGTAQSDHDATAGQFEADMVDLLDALTPLVDCVRWIDLQEEPAPFYAGFNYRRFAANEIIHRVADDYANVEYFHYAAWIDVAPASYRWWDDLHLTEAGDAALGRIVRELANGCDPALTSGPFWDVPDAHWAANDITWLHDNGIATGYANHTYRAEIGTFRIPVTRGQFINMLWQANDSPTIADPHPFTDTSPWLDPALRWAWSTGIVRGWPDNTFRPTQPITRAATTRTLWLDAHQPTGHPDHPFTDIPAWLDADAVNWITAAGIANGWADNTYRPTQPLTRAQIAHLLHQRATIATPTPTTEPPTSTTTTEPPATNTTTTNTTTSAITPTTEPSTTVPSDPDR
jgi:hypothetical protein